MKRLVRVISSIIILLMVGCTVSRPIDPTKVCPKYPKLSKFECFKKLKGWRSFICKSKERYYHCFDEQNARQLLNDILVLKKCIELYEKEINFYNSVIINQER